MKKTIFVALGVALLFSGCAGEFNSVYKSTDSAYKYEYAKAAFAEGKYNNAITLLQELIVPKKGTDEAQECLYMLGMAEYCNRDYESAASTFRRYCASYPKGIYAEMASFYIGQSLYESAPEPRLDQTPTINAITAFQQFIDLYPESSVREKAQQRMFELQDKLIIKEYLSAALYYKLGDYFMNCSYGGSNYDACIITAQNALRLYPFTDKREDFAVLIMKSKFDLAERSIESKRIERYRDAIDECYGFINEYPESKERATAEAYIAKCKKVVGE